MHSHPHFDLYLHSNEELGEILGEPVTGRETLHEWPLSCVERLNLATGQTCIYKTESGPTVEPEFYESARSVLLPLARTIYRDDRYACLILEDIAGTPLAQAPLNQRSAMEIGRMVLQQIAGISGDFPVYLDISTWERWQAQMAGMLDDLSGLLSSRRFEVTRPDDLDTLSRAAQSSLVRSAFDRAPSEGGMGIVHHDLNADNILLQSPGRSPSGGPVQNIQQAQVKVIDWQRPLRGPADIDLALLLTSLGFDPRPHLRPGILTATNLLRAHWLVECAQTWFPPGLKTYDQAIAGIARSLP